jgi:hypothetical protein
MPTRNRIKSHRRVRAGDLVPHEWNFRTHPEAQQAALRAIYDEVGFARSLLAYELPDGRLKLIDGHLRRDIDPDMEVDVEILDVNDQEAQALLLSIDPLASLAETQEQLHRRLLDQTPTKSEELHAAWQATVDRCLTDVSEDASPAVMPGPPQFLILITCRDEPQQIALLRRLTTEGHDCRALLS